MMRSVPEYKIEACRGVASDACPHRVPVSPDFAERLAETVSRSGWPEFLRQCYGGKHHFHHSFRIAISGCANGCSRPHIQDLGLIRAQRPALDAGGCVSCGLCEQSCPDAAITMREEDGEGRERLLPHIDPERCLSCGHCIRVCPVGALEAIEDGWRIVAGGRLGRRPALARELPGIHGDAVALGLVERALRLYMTRWRPGLRFGALLDETGLAPLQGGAER